MQRINWERAAAAVICIAAGGAALYLALRYALPILLPFLLAWLFSWVVRPIAARISHRTRLPQKVTAVLLLVLFLGGTVLVLCVSVSRLIRELQNLLSRLLAENGSVSDAVLNSADYFEALTSRFGFFGQDSERLLAFRESFNEMIAGMIESFFHALSAGLPAFAGRLVAVFPSLLLVLLVTVISGFYFCIDGERIEQGLVGLLPSSLRARLPRLRSGAKTLTWKYLRAYLLLMLLTFAELFIGFSILGVEYAFLLGLIVAVIDMLPVLGVGSVLIPWAAVMLIQKSFYPGFGLLILYFSVLILRQITEPRLVGRSLGLHPLLTVFASYAGWKLLGLLGMILGPVIALLIKSLAESLPKA